MPEKRKQNDDWNRDSKQPEKNSSTHDRPLPLYVGVENSVVPAANRPPSPVAGPSAKTRIHYRGRALWIGFHLNLQRADLVPRDRWSAND